jgi:hypothetical protein
MLNVYYEKSTKLWVAYYTDSIGQLGDAEYAHDRDDAVFTLGWTLGRFPHKFTRPMAQFFEQEERE